MPSRRLAVGCFRLYGESAKPVGMSTPAGVGTGAAGGSPDQSGPSLDRSGTFPDRPGRGTTAVGSPTAGAGLDGQVRPRLLANGQTKGRSRPCPVKTHRIPSSPSATCSAPAASRSLLGQNPSDHARRNSNAASCPVKPVDSFSTVRTGRSLREVTSGRGKNADCRLECNVAGID